MAGQILEGHIWQMTAQDRLTWRRHDEPSPNHGALRLPNDGDECGNIFLFLT